MGNPDLVIIINQIVFYMNGTEYENRNEAIKKSIDGWQRYMENLKATADKPSELFFDITEIKIYEYFEN